MDTQYWPCKPSQTIPRISTGVTFVPISRDTIASYSAIILDHFDHQVPLLQCIHQLKKEGLEFDSKVDLAKESEFLETVKDIALQTALKENDDVAPSEFAMDFMLIMHGRKEFDRRAFVELIVGIDAVLTHDRKATREVKSALKATLTYVKKIYPDVLTWLPLKYEQFVRTFKGV
jgi:hypothetical protein